MSRFAIAITALVAAAPGRAQASCALYPELCGLDVNSTTEQDDLDHAIDVVLVGDGFTDMDAWHTKAASAIATFKGHTNANVYGAVPEIYNFHVVDVVSETTDVGNDDLTDTALGMNTSGGTISAHGSRVSTAALNAPDVDVTIAIANSSSGRANANYPSQLASGGRMRLASLGPITHEMGHAVIGLADEYVEASLCNNTPPRPSNLVRRANVTAESTCLKFDTTPGAHCVQGGHYCATGVWRSASGCLMRSSGDTATCPVCARTVREVLAQKRTGVDFAEPWGVLSAPSAGATVSGVVNLRAYAYDDHFAPMTVAFVIDGAYVGSAVANNSGGASLEYDTRQLSDGDHTATVFIDDVAGFATASIDVLFVVANSSTTGELTITFAQPSDGDTVSGVVSVRGNIEGTGTRAFAVLVVDGVPMDMRTPNSASYVFFHWDTSSLSPGDHTLELRLRDPADNETSSGEITVTVEPAVACSGAGFEGSCVYVFWPMPWAPVGPLFDVSYTIHSISPPATVDLSVDGNVVMPSVLPPHAGRGMYRALIDARSWILGPHYIEVTADNGSVASTSDPTAVVRVAPGGVPVAYVLLPIVGEIGAASGQVEVTVAAYDDVSVADLSLVIDDIDVAQVMNNPGTYMWDTTLESDGDHELIARATDGDSNIGWSNTLRVLVDNSPPVVAIVDPLDGSQVPPGVVAVTVSASDDVSSVERVELWVDGVAVWEGNVGRTPFASLNPGAHSLFVRAFDRAGNQGDSLTVNVTAVDCQTDGCEDNDACTSDTCSPLGRCIYVRIPGCCEGPEDCDDGDECTVDACDADTCTRTLVPGCCNYGYACHDGVATTQDICSGPGGTCSHPDHARCDVGSECDDSHACTVDTCILAPQGLCANNWTPDCCAVAADCDNGNPCTIDGCDGGTCTRTPVPDCCVRGSECDDGEVCTYDACVDNACANPPIGNCCESEPDCIAYNPCAVMSCNLDSNRCQQTLTESCCTFDFECDDRVPCSADFCDGGVCDALTEGHCCADPSDCVDLDPCTNEDCVDGACVRPRIPGCCVTAEDCDEGDPCILYTCDEEQNVCQQEAISDCCHGDDDCDEGDPCITYTCDDNHVCQQEPVNGCCHDADDCDEGDPCITYTCDDNNACQQEPIRGCCRDAADCDEGDPCVVYTCDDNHACQQETDASCNEEDDPPGVGVRGGCGCGPAGASRLGGAVVVVLALWRRRRRAV